MVLNVTENYAVDAFRYAMRSARSCGFFSPGKTIFVPGMYCIKQIYTILAKQRIKKQDKMISTSTEMISSQSRIQQTNQNLPKHSLPLTDRV